MTGPATLACVDGTHWNGSAPHCKGSELMSDQPVDGVISKASENIINMATYMAMVMAYSQANWWHSHQ